MPEHNCVLQHVGWSEFIYHDDHQKIAMTNQEKQQLENVTNTLGTLIAWLYTQLGEAGTKELLDMLNKGIIKEKP